MRTNLEIGQHALGFRIRALLAGAVSADGWCTGAAALLGHLPGPGECGDAQYQLVAVGLQRHGFVHLRLDVLPGQPVGVYKPERGRVVGQLGRTIRRPEVVHHQREVVHVLLQSREVKVHCTIEKIWIGLGSGVPESDRTNATCVVFYFICNICLEKKFQQ